MPLKKANSFLLDILLKISGNDKKDLVILVYNWEKIVGKLLASRSRVVKVENKIAFVAVKDSSWTQELVLLKHDLIKKIKKLTNIKLDNILFYQSID